MTLPEHAICSLMVAHLGAASRYGNRGAVAVVVAGIAPDLDALVKPFDSASFWRLHHAVGHGLLPVLILSGLTAWAWWRFGNLRPYMPLFGWCLLAAGVHILTDSLYWFPMRLLWPFSGWEYSWRILEYLDVFVLAIWFGGAWRLWRVPLRREQVSRWTLALFASYSGLRVVLPAPTGFLKWMTGGWMYMAPQGTPVLDWW